MNFKSCAWKYVGVFIVDKSISGQLDSVIYLKTHFYIFRGNRTSKSIFYEVKRLLNKKLSFTSVIIKLSSINRIKQKIHKIFKAIPISNTPNSLINSFG